MRLLITGLQFGNRAGQNVCGSPLAYALGSVPCELGEVFFSSHGPNTAMLETYGWTILGISLVLAVIVYLLWH